ncbi:MAG: phenylalanine--tRNA ligase subunit alpha, partial [Kiritimatiellae bacterium]|nr:phenylalanine--tRNA ligase subunit alpha [Kiritimatiellia bacterium]
MTLAELEEAKALSLEEIAAASDAAAAEALRVKYVGRNGSIPALIKAMKDVPKEERPAFGKAVQAWRAAVEAALAAKAGEKAGEKAVDADLTMPGRWWNLGVKHPLSRVVEESAAIFGKLGFSVADGPELENKFNNFTALNTPTHHPSQDRRDTFWLESPALKGEKGTPEDLLLRTQTSPVQIRTMLQNK